MLRPSAVVRRDAPLRGKSALCAVVVIVSWVGLCATLLMTYNALTQPLFQSDTLNRYSIVCGLGLNAWSAFVYVAGYAHRYLRERGVRGL